MILRGHRAVMQHPTVGCIDLHPSLAADAFDLAALQPRQRIVASTEYGEFQTGGTGVQYAQATILHPSWPFTSGACMVGALSQTSPGDRVHDQVRPRPVNRPRGGSTTAEGRRPLHR